MPLCLLHEELVCGRGVHFHAQVLLAEAALKSVLFEAGGNVLVDFALAVVGQCRVYGLVHGRRVETHQGTNLAALRALGRVRHFALQQVDETRDRVASRAGDEVLLYQLFEGDIDLE